MDRRGLPQNEIEITNPEPQANIDFQTFGSRYQPQMQVVSQTPAINIEDQAVQLMDPGSRGGFEHGIEIGRSPRLETQGVQANNLMPTMVSKIEILRHLMFTNRLYIMYHSIWMVLSAISLFQVAYLHEAPWLTAYMTVKCVHHIWTIWLHSYFLYMLNTELRLSLAGQNPHAQIYRYSEVNVFESDFQKSSSILWKGKTYHQYFTLFVIILSPPVFIYVMVLLFEETHYDILYALIVAVILSITDGIKLSRKCTELCEKREGSQQQIQPAQQLPFKQRSGQVILPRLTGRRYDIDDKTRQTTCTICLQDLKPGDEYVALQCSKDHCFHRSCIQLWLGKKQVCPNCMAPVDVKLLLQVYQLGNVAR